MRIRIIATGGTFDKEHDPISESFVFNKTHIPKILKRARCLLPTKIETLMLIDSLNITARDQQKILKACQKSKEKNIVITHGTSNMEKTAIFLGEKIKDKTIVLTGAMVPYAFRNSDALFNMGASLALAQTLPAGVYVAMNGKIYPWDNVTKDAKKGLFKKKKQNGK